MDVMKNVQVEIHNLKAKSGENYNNRIVVLDQSVKVENSTNNVNHGL